VGDIRVSTEYLKLSRLSLPVIVFISQIISHKGISSSIAENKMLFSKFI
jgi:hypothetical protein